MADEKEKGQEKKVETPEVQEKETEISLADKDAEIADLKAQLAAASATDEQTKGKETETKVEETETQVTLADTQTQDELKALREEMDALRNEREAESRKAYFNAKIEGINPSHPSLVALQKNEDFNVVDLTEGQIDMIVDPIVASITAEGRHTTVLPTVTMDGHDKIRALVAAAVSGQTVELTSGSGEKATKTRYEPLPILQLAHQYGGLPGFVTGHENPASALFEDLGEAMMGWGPEDEKMIDETATEFKLATATTTSTQFPSTMLQTIVQNFYVLFNTSEFMMYMNTLIPANRRVSVPDYQDRLIPFGGLTDIPEMIAEDADIPEKDTFTAFRVNIKPNDYAEIHTLSRRGFLNGPDAAVRQISTNLADIHVLRYFWEYMNIAFGFKTIAGTANGRTKAVVREGANSAAIDMYQATGDVPNLIRADSTASENNTVELFTTYNNAVAMMNRMMAAKAYGNNKARMARNSRPRYWLVAPESYITARTLVESRVRPGAQNSEATAIRDLDVIPVDYFNTTNGITSGTGATFRADQVMVADPMRTFGIGASFLQGRQRPRMIPDTSREKWYTNRRLRMQAEFIFATWAVDRRAFVLSTYRPSGD